MTTHETRNLIRKVNKKLASKRQSIQILRGPVEAHPKGDFCLRDDHSKKVLAWYQDENHLWEETREILNG